MTAAQVIMTNITPKLATAGLMYHLDINNSSSWTSGSTVNDLAGSGLGGTTLVMNGSGNESTLSYIWHVATNSSYAITPNLVSKFNSPSNSSVTLEIWIKATSDNGVILNELGSTTLVSSWHDTQMEIVSGELRMRLWQGAYAAAGTFPRDRWNQCVLTYDGTTMRTYLNAQPGGTSAFTRSLPWDNAAGLYYAIAAYDNVTNLGDGTYLDCLWTQFRVYNRALTPSEVINNYTATKKAHFQ